MTMSANIEGEGFECAGNMVNGSWIAREAELELVGKEGIGEWGWNGLTLACDFGVYSWPMAGIPRR